MNNFNEEQLREIAQKRIDFKRHFLVYLVVVAILWLVWAVSASTYPWPIWPAAGWGIAILFLYIRAYHNFRIFSVEKEIENLK